MINTQISEQEFIGSGAYSNVYKVILNNKIYALKKIHPYLLKDQNKRNEILRQIEIMKSLDHPNIIKFYQCIENNDNQINLLLEYADGGTLYDYLKIREKLSEEQAKKYIQKVVQAVKYLHSKPQPILHRDIKPQNILLTKNGQCKLADFGSSNILDGQRTTFVGTKQYMAPEVVDSVPYGQAIDLWCIGLLTFQLLMGYLPKQKQGQQLIVNSNISRAAQDLIKRLLHQNPNQRMTLSQLLNHIWLNDDDNQNQNIKNQKISKKNQIMNRIIKKNEQLNKQYKQKTVVNLNLSSLKKIEDSSKQKQQTNSQNLQKQAEQYLKLVNLKAELKVQIQKHEDSILSILDQYQNQKQYKIQEMQRMLQKIKQNEQNIQILKKNPLKFSFQCRSILRDFMKKLDLLYQYVEYLPRKLQQEVLDMPTIKINYSSQKINQSILKQKTQILQYQRDVLTEILINKKRYKSIVERRTTQN